VKLKCIYIWSSVGARERECTRQESDACGKIGQICGRADLIGLCERERRSLWSSTVKQGSFAGRNFSSRNGVESFKRGQAVEMSMF